MFDQLLSFCNRRRMFLIDENGDRSGLSYLTGFIIMPICIIVCYSLPFELASLCLFPPVPSMPA